MMECLMQSPTKQPKKLELVAVQQSVHVNECMNMFQHPTPLAMLHNHSNCWRLWCQGLTVRSRAELLSLVSKHNFLLVVLDLAFLGLAGDCVFLNFKSAFSHLCCCHASQCLTSSPLPKAQLVPNHSAVHAK